MSRLLAALKSTKQKVVFRDKGICANAKYYVEKMTRNLGDGLCQEACDYAEHQMRVLMRRWPKCADEYGNFPIEGRWAEYELRAAKDELWSDPLRLELLDWVIEELENEFRKPPAESAKTGS